MYIIPKESLKGKILNSQEMVGEDPHRSSDNTDLQIDFFSAPGLTLAHIKF